MTGITKVRFQDNPYSNGYIDENIGTWTYGNYGGPGWTGGEFTPPGQESDFKPPALDKLDQIFMDHDRAYENAAKLSGYLQARAIMDADRAMLNSINTMLRDAVANDEKLEPDLVLGAVMAQKAFEVKRVANMASLVNNIPLDLDTNPFGTVNLTTGGNDALITELQTLFTTAENTVSPLVLDLDGDGVETTALTKGAYGGVHFNLDAKGLSEQTGWVGKDDGLLVRDLDGNGKIDSGRELFGNHTLLKSGAQAANGFEALKDLDSNADGVIDSKDAAFASLRVWKDLNSNGVTDAGELLTLAQAGVQSLKVAYTNSSTSTTTDAQGNAHKQTGGYTTTAGQSRGMNNCVTVYERETV